jgi:hypothetical protein
MLSLLVQMSRGILADYVRAEGMAMLLSFLVSGQN